MENFLDPGDTVAVTHENKSQNLVVVSHAERTINGFEWTIYNLENAYFLYMNNNYTRPNTFEINGHLITSENEILSEPYYMRRNLKVTFPVSVSALS